MSFDIAMTTVLEAAPIALAALGGVISERAGVVNFALEGTMLSGALAAVAVSYYTGSPYLGLAAAVAAGMAIAALHAAASLWLRVNQIISSIALNLLSLGITGALLWHVFGQGTSPSAPTLPGVVIGGQTLNILVAAPFVLAPIVWLAMRHTVWGLHLRATGEDTAAARSAGVRVARVKATAVLLSGVLAGAAGALISIGALSTFTSGMTNGRGYIAVAAVIFGKWSPIGAVAAALLFGFFSATAESLSGGTGMPKEFYNALPYLLTLVALAGFVGTSRPPGDLGRVEGAE